MHLRGRRRRLKRSLRHGRILVQPQIWWCGPSHVCSGALSVTVDMGPQDLAPRSLEMEAGYDQISEAQPGSLLQSVGSITERYGDVSRVFAGRGEVLRQR